MLKEQQFWFSQFADVNVTSTSPIWSATYAVANTPANWTPGQTQTYTVTVTNHGEPSWPSTCMARGRLGVHSANAAGGYANVAGWRTDQRFDLPSDLAPGG